ncbi:MAG: phage head closure protein [Pigmentiphaga sp.]
MISLFRAVEGEPNSFNEANQQWRCFATVSAAVKPISDGERWRAAQVAADITTRFRIRYSKQVADLDPRDRIRFDGREYDIIGVKEIGRRQGLEITACARGERDRCG